MIAIAQSLADSVHQFLIKLFKRFQSPSPVVVLNPAAPSPAEIPQTQKEKPRKIRTYDKEKTKTFSDLLDNLEYTFESIKLPTMKESWLNQDSVIGLKKMGVHIPNPWVSYPINEESTVDIKKPLPAIMCISSASAETVNTGDKIWPKIMFAIKLKKLPWYVTKASGIPYQFGMAYDWNGKLFWVNLHLVINKESGAISFCDELKIKEHRIGKSKSYHNKAWNKPSYLIQGERTIERNKLYSKQFFIAMHEWWSARDNRWNVVVKKSGERITFGVDNSQTPFYFKDRDKSIKTVNGQTKKIVHYVKEHERRVNGKIIVIKEHIRGLQEFDWSGYNCQVISPKFQSKTSASFTIGGDEDLQSSNVIYLSKLGKILAESEEIKTIKKIA